MTAIGWCLVIAGLALIVIIVGLFTDNFGAGFPGDD